MREREEEEGKERRGTRKKKHEERCTEKNGTRKEEAYYRIYFVSERWFAAYPGAQKNRASSSSTIKSAGAGRREEVNYGNHEFSVTGGDFKKLFSTRARNCTRPLHVETSRDPRDGGREGKGYTPRRISIPG